MDVTLVPGEADREAVSMLNRTKSPVILIVNKIDLLDNREQTLPAMEFFRTLHAFEEFLPVSALDEHDVKKLRELITARLPEGPSYFPADTLQTSLRGSLPQS